ncbi:hypothetical protein ONZ51_g4040 [Trametes cubensis]|uniref:DUF6534 domain-containing protein n=1 Tax=Trametes cubensis TaxID=1111947 RepID=A0AAD7XAM7_9APHY|nr:hypothetical protein ONZ51_g4040 [Trametes cubensis]
MPDFAAPSLGLAAMCETMGAVILGGVLGLMSYGVTIHQVYRYFAMYPADRASLKFFVVILLVLETWHIVVWLAAGYHYNIEGHYTNEISLGGHWYISSAQSVSQTTHNERSAELQVDKVSNSSHRATQCFYAYRVYSIGPRYKWLVMPAVLCLVIYQGFAFAAGIKAFQATDTVADFESLSHTSGLSRSRAGLKCRTDTILDTLIKYTINTGLLTSISGLSAFIFAMILPGNLIYAGITIVGTKLYANSALALLNSRRFINRQLTDDFVSFNISELTRLESLASPLRRVTIASTIAWNAPRASLGTTISIGHTSTGYDGTSTPRTKREDSAGHETEG